MNEKGDSLKALIKLALPAVMQQLMGTLLQYVDTAMVGHLGEVATASVSTSTTVNWLVHSIPYGLTVGLLSTLSQACGRGDRDEMKRLAAMGSRLSLWLGLSLTAVCLGISPFLPAWMQAAEEIRQSASEYFFVVSLSLAFSVTGGMFASALHAVKDTRTPMIINLSAMGAAYATGISTALCGVVMFIAFRHKEALRFEREEFFAIDSEKLWKLLRVGLPVMATSAVSCSGYIVFAGMVNGMGVTTFAAHSIAVTAEEIFYLPGYGIRTASSALIGSSIGEGNRRKFRDIRRQSILLTGAVMAISGIVLFFAAYPLMRMFTISQPVAESGAKVLRMVAFSEPFFGLMVSWEGISYGTGRTRSVFIIEALSMWGVRICMTYVVIRAGMGLTAVWWCMIADNVTKAVLLTLVGLRQSEKQLFKIQPA